MKPTIILVARLSQDGDVVRMDMETLGDLTPSGWKPGKLETGPNFFGVKTFPGKLPATLPVEAIDAIGMQMQRAMSGEIAKLIAVQD